MVNKVSAVNTSAPQLYKNLKSSVKPLDKFIQSQENLSYTRFIQDTVTNWVPKAMFARSLADFGDMSFLEFLESGIFYFAPPLIGEFLLRRKMLPKLNPKKAAKTINEHLTDSLESIAKNKELQKGGLNKRIVAAKAAMVVGCACVPIAEYMLSFAKNLFTLKVFKKSNFDNIANLDKSKEATKENTKQQEKVEKNAKRNLKKGAVMAAGGFAASAAIAAYGHKSDAAQKVFKAILQPADVIAKVFPKVKDSKLDKFLHEYTKLDFDNSNGKLALSKGQLAVTTISGLFGYSEAAKDRGKLDFYEVWTRVPLVVSYTIFGSSMFDYMFKKHLIKNHKYPDLVNKNSAGDIHIPTRKELPDLAQKIAKERNLKAQDVMNRLVKEKAVITAVPYAFALLFMGFSLAAVSRIWTQYRYNQQKKNNNDTQTNSFVKPSFTAFLNKKHGIKK